jgi:hypothetical protein
MRNSVTNKVHTWHGKTFLPLVLAQSELRVVILGIVL